MSLATPDLLRFAYLSLKGNLIRSLLSTLGVFMGVFSVSATLEANNLGKAYLSQQLNEREAPQITIFSGWNRDTEDRYELRQDDLAVLRRSLVGWRAISALGQGEYDANVLFEEEEASTELVSVSLDHLDTSGRKVMQGRFFLPGDFDNFRSVALVDEFLLDELFKGHSPIGKSIYINNSSFSVIGVIDSRSEFWTDEPRGAMWVPLSTYSVITGQDTIQNISIRPHNIDDLERLETAAVDLLKHRAPTGEFYAWNNIQDITALQRILTVVSLILLVLGGITLSVGGVGIANIMIASTVERTSEIGLRRAIGATQQEILVQFVLEALLISCVGGTVAIGATQGITVLVANTFQLPHQFNPATALMALGAAVGVGVGSSFFPALQASRLDPVNALRE